MFLTAPYNNAMRIGSGFNSFTQALCINDAVIKDNRKSANDADLQVMQNPGGETSQIVVYDARFVESASEVLDYLNVSGAVTVKLASVGGGSARITYLQTEQMKNSDLNYLISVKVVNQKLVAPDVTRFNPIPNLPPTSFTDTYGDSFISGFVEGGEFYALMSVVVNDKSKIQDITGALTVDIKQAGGAVEIGGEAAIDYKNHEINSNATTTISVAWSGGGQIRPPEDIGQDWTFDSMKHAANGFAEKVAQYPQRVSAILTKYSGLRSYQEMTNKGTPLDYENAGVYTNALLDAYVDYKDIWKRLAYLSTKEQYGPCLIARNDKAAELSEYAQQARDDYIQKLKNFYYPDTHPPALEALMRDNSQSNPTADGNSTDDQSLIRSGDARSKTIQDLDKQLASLNHDIVVAKQKLAVVQKGEVFDPPLKPNPLKPYAASIIGLDAARRDCRWEMIKIVKEVDAVANDPAVATDTNRIWQYLNPIVFRQLIPDLKTPEPPYSQSDYDRWEASRKKQIDDLNEKMKSAIAAKDQEIASQKQHEIDALAAKDNDIKIARDDSTALRANIQSIITDNVKAMEQQKEHERLAIIASATTFDNVINTQNERVKSLETDLDKAKIAAGAPSLVQSAYDQMQARYETLKKAYDDLNTSNKSITDAVGKLDSSVQSLQTPAPLIDAVNRVESGLKSLQASTSVVDAVVKVQQGVNALQTPTILETVKRIESDVQRIETDVQSLQPPASASQSNTKGKSFSGFGGIQLPNIRNAFVQDKINFDPVADTRPRVLTALNWLEVNSPSIGASSAVIGIVSASAVPSSLTLGMGISSSMASKTGFTLQREAGSGVFTSLGASWLTLPDNGFHFEHGIIDIAGLADLTNENKFSTNITFGSAFLRNPTVVMWIMGAEWRTSPSTTSGARPALVRRLLTRPSDLATEGFVAHIETWLDTICSSARVGWLAWDGQETNAKVQSGSRSASFNNGLPSTCVDEFISFAPGFSRPPAMLFGFSRIDASSQDKALRVGTRSPEITQAHFHWNFGSWNDSTLYEAISVWIAME